MTKEERRAYNRNYYQTHKEQEKERHRRWRELNPGKYGYNPEKHKEYMAEWYQKNKERLREKRKEYAKDRVTIVRCKDCKHGISGTYDTKENKPIYIDCDKAETHEPDWYCADGEKR